MAVPFHLDWKNPIGCAIFWIYTFWWSMFYLTDDSWISCYFISFFWPRLHRILQHCLSRHVARLISYINIFFKYGVMKMLRTMKRNTQSPRRIDTAPTLERQSQNQSWSRGREPRPPAESTLPSDPVLSSPPAPRAPRLESTCRPAPGSVSTSKFSYRPMENCNGGSRNFKTGGRDPGAVEFSGIWELFWCPFSHTLCFVCHKRICTCESHC